LRTIGPRRAEERLRAVCSENAVEGAVVAATLPAPHEAAERRIGAALIRMAGDQAPRPVPVAEPTPGTGNVDTTPEGGLEVQGVEAGPTSRHRAPVDELEDEATAAAPPRIVRTLPGTVATSAGLGTLSADHRKVRTVARWRKGKPTRGRRRSPAARRGLSPPGIRTGLG
jgi:hypothetical protein